MYLNWINQMPEESANGENARLKALTYEEIPAQSKEVR